MLVIVCFLFVLYSLVLMHLAYCYPCEIFGLSHSVFFLVSSLLLVIVGLYRGFLCIDAVVCGF